MSSISRNTARSGLRQLRIIVVLSMLLGMLSPFGSLSPAFADNADLSGDIVTSGNNTTLSFGTNVCSNTMVTKNIVVAVSRQGNGNAYANSASLNVAVNNVAGAGFSAPTPSAHTITLPSNWKSQSNGTLSTSVTVIVTFNAASPAAYSGSLTISITGAQDGGGTLTRSSSVALSATVVNCDTTPPTLNLPANMTVEATGPTGAVATYSATATDTNPANPTVTCAPASGSTFPIGSTTVNCSATDAAGNTARGSFTVTVQDTTGPVISGTPSNMTVPAVNASGAIVNYTNPTASDAVDGSRPVTCIPASGSTFPLGQTTVTCTSTDTRNNTSKSTFVIDVKDQAAPVLQLPGSVTAEATSASGAVVTYAATAVDNVDGTRPVTCAPASGTTFPLGTTTVTCSATDAAGNTNSGSFFVTVQDTTPPALTVPAPITVEATGAGGATVTYTASASDVVDGAIAPSCSPASGSMFALGTTTVNCSATDAHGNSSSQSFNVVVRDTTAPVLHLPADQTLEATSPSGAVADFSVSAADLVDGSVNVDCSANPGTFPLGTTTITCSAMDAHENKAQGSFTIKVQDTQSPVLTLPGNTTVEATGPTGAQITFDATASDIATASITPSCSPASGSTFALGTTTVNCSATDPSGNGSHGSFTVTVQDTTAPSLATGLTGVNATEASGGAHVTYNLPVTTDLVDGPVTPSCSPVSGSLFPLGSNTITCSASDSHGNAATRTYNILVVDQTAPVLSLPSTLTEEATGASGAVVSYDTTADDTVSGPVNPVCSPASGSTFPLGTTTVTCSATDPSGNASSGTFSVVVQDTTKPALTVPGPTVAEATGPAGAHVAFSAFAIDIVDGPVAVSCDQASGSMFPIGVTTVNCSAADAHGNLSADTFTVEVKDTTAPALHLPADITAEADSTSGATVNYAPPTATDLVDGTVSVNCEVDSGSVFGPGVTAVGCSATDAHGNTARGSFSVTVTDTTPPRLTLPADITEEATGPDGAAVEYLASAYDILDGAVAVSCDKTSGDTFDLGSTTVTCSAVDKHSNGASSSFRITVQDTTPPAINGELADLTAEATSGSGALVTYTSPTGYDLVDGTVPVTCSPASGSTFALGSTTVTCSATDSRNNTASRTFTVKVQDTTAPVLSLPQYITAEAVAASGAPVTYQASANDTVDGPVTPNCAPTSGSTFPLGSTTVSCSAADRQGNTAHDSFPVTVVDTTPPVLQVPGDIVNEATGPNGAAVTYTAPSATDLVDGAITPVCDKASGSVFALGETIVSCTATDAHSNEVSDSFRVTVVDTTPPALTQPENITAEATGHDGAPVTFISPTATDLVDGTDAVVCTPASGTVFALGNTSVSCAASDAHNNESRVDFTVTVKDTTPPTLTLSGDQTVEATGPEGAQVTYSASAEDIVDGGIATSCSPDSSSVFPLGTTTVTCSATDAHNNTATQSMHVSVQDTTPPTILGNLANIVAEATSGSGAKVSYTSPTAQDIVDGPVTVTCSPASESTFPLGENTVTCSASDAAGNGGSRAFKVKIQDTSAPVLALPNNMTVEATGPTGAPVTYQASANDVVDGQVTPTCAPASGTTFALGTTTVNCSATDGHGNTSSGSFTGTVVDTTPPTLSQQADITKEATGPNGAAVTFTPPTATDLVDGTRTVTCSPVSGSTFPLGDTTVTCSASDTRGNIASTSFKVTVQDTTAPTITVPHDIATIATSAGGAPVTFSASANDVVDGPRPVTCSPASGSLFGAGTTTVTCSATDEYNNTDSRSFHVTVTFAWSGVLQPVNPDGTSLFKLGSTIPVKFNLTGASANITNAAVRLYVRTISGNVSGTEQEAISTSAANIGNLFRYDPSGRQYIFNLGTKGLTAGTWQMRIDFGDGVNRTVNFSLRP